MMSDFRRWYGWITVIWFAASIGAGRTPKGGILLTNDEEIWSWAAQLHDPYVTRNSYHLFTFLYNEEAFGGLALQSADRLFGDALSAHR